MCRLYIPVYWCRVYRGGVGWGDPCKAVALPHYWIVWCNDRIGSSGSIVRVATETACVQFSSELKRVRRMCLLCLLVVYRHIVG